MTEKISILIKALRMPLMIAVVFIHCFILDDASVPFVTFVERLFSRILPSVAVPMFLFFAGYLFFVKDNGIFTYYSYCQKLKKRIKTLLLPYIIWNGITVLAFWLIHRFLPGFINPEFENIANYPPPQLLNCFWMGSGGFPIAYQFWFIRDLMLFVIASPLFYAIVCYLRQYGLLIFTVIFLFCDAHYPSMAYAFFLGCYCAINRINFPHVGRKLLVPNVIILTLSLIISMLNVSDRVLWIRLYILSSALIIFALPVWKVDNAFVKFMSRLSDASFFVFAYHGLAALVFSRVLLKIIPLDNQWLWIAAYFGAVAFLVTLGIAIYRVLKLLSPRFISMLTGGR